MGSDEPFVAQVRKISLGLTLRQVGLTLFHGEAEFVVRFSTLERKPSYHSFVNRQLCIYVDVDDTLVRSAGSKRIPIPTVIRHVDELHRGGALLYGWSSGGADYARQSAEEFGIAHCFTAFLPKPHVIIDDQCVAEWPQFLHIHPSATCTLDEYRATLEGTSRAATNVS